MQHLAISVSKRAAGASPPTRAVAWLFAAKVAAFRLRRSLIDLADGPARGPQAAADGFPAPVAVSRTPLWAEIAPAEAALQRGKVHNLRAAARRLDRTLIDPGKTFSFWAQLGRASRARGFAPGRMLQEGCLVPSVGGGLCQLSNALYDVALGANCEIVERHAHSRLVPGSMSAAGRDATVAWNYVDLRFRSSRRLQLRVQVERDILVVGLFAPGPETAVERRQTPSDDAVRPAAASCGSCGETRCFRHESGSAHATGGTAFLVDAYWPEFDAFIARQRSTRDTLCLPLDGRRWSKPQYGWNTDGFADIVTAPAATLYRSLSGRALAAQGAARQLFLLRAADRLAARYARALTEDVTTVCVAQTLLPFLWRSGHLGGRRFSVLMTRLPMAVLQARLDDAAARHPGSSTLSDFRAPPELVAAETEALAAADEIVTPHAGIAELFGARTVHLDWASPPACRMERTPRARSVAFPGPTVARKGAYELREAARALDLEVLPLGSELEGAEFWNGLRTCRTDEWLNGVAAVVQPAFVEDAPRRLLAALAAGVPVIATAACGLSPRDGLTLVAEGDVEGLTRELAARL